MMFTSSSSSSSSSLLMSPLLLLLLVVSAAITASSTTFEAQFTQYKPGRFIGPEFFPTPLQSWMVGQDGKGVQVIGDSDFSRGQTMYLHLLTHQIEEPAGLESESQSDNVAPLDLIMTTEFTFVETGFQPFRTYAGFSVGMSGGVDDYRFVVSTPFTDRLEAGLRADGKLFVKHPRIPNGQALSGRALPIVDDDSGTSYRLTLSYVGDGSNTVRLTATTSIDPLKEILLEVPNIQPSVMMGNMALMAQSCNVLFKSWEVGGSTADGGDDGGEGWIVRHDDQTFGPIAWSQYTIDERTEVLKMNVQMVPVDPSDGDVTLELLLDPTSVSVSTSTDITLTKSMEGRLPESEVTGYGEAEASTTATVTDDSIMDSGSDADDDKEDKKAGNKKSNKGDDDDDDRRKLKNKLMIIKNKVGNGEVDADADPVIIEISNEWTEVATAPVDALSRTALFRIDFEKYFEQSRGNISYRVKYVWNSQPYYWYGTIRQSPVDDDEFRIATFSCDHGYAFPLPKMVRNVQIQDPDVVFFAGDQIYEAYGGYGYVTGPLELSMLDYLRKWYLFGWTWRDVLKDRVTVIVADDHDVYMGNLWGEGGKALDISEPVANGGYVMPPEWVNAVQRTQTDHLPDPYDPTPIEQGISVYYTDFIYGGVPIAVLEDRKWKSAPNSVLIRSWKSSTNAKEELNPPEAVLLGERQESFIQDWADRTATNDLRVVLSATIFAHAATHVGDNLLPDKNNCDSNGWPKDGRDRALRPLLNNPNTVMLHGDQHMGILVKHGVDKHEDGPYAFMVPGTANGYPRSWWPEGQEAPEDTWTGQFEDDFGNMFTVYAAANPDNGSNMLDQWGPIVEESAHKRGSGYGVMTFNKQTSVAQFDMWRFDFDASNPRADGSDQFSGFPQSFTLEDISGRRTLLADRDNANQRVNSPQGQGRSEVREVRIGSWLGGEIIKSSSEDDEKLVSTLKEVVGALKNIQEAGNNKS